MSDPQRRLVYEAEHALAGMIDRRLDFPVVSAFGSRVAVPDDRKFGDLESVQRYVDAVLALAWVRAGPTGARPVRVRARAGAGKAEYEFATATIAVPPHRVGGQWAMRELVIVHELAHHLADAADHGPAFVAQLLELVTELVGPEAGFLLRSGLLAAGVGVG
ncbi:TIGR04338 family metallohydrolase [uncultured Jatrophihabitans sp.]|uniref:TIGR04338 family metallohydrolase n=1 Tax=uncultured Jatrophihabitans sp. TaxID=1610747 RepID=UPI0035CC5BC4